MRNILYCLCFVVGLISCFNDDSTLGTKVIGDIEIEGLKDTSIISYSGNRLDIEPVISTIYPEEQLKYAWYMYDAEAASLVGEGLENGYRENLIAEGKNLSYEVNLPSGTYTFVLEVTSKQNGFTRIASMKVAVSTAFSQGFYILKETKDGNSELDLFTNDGLNSNLMSKLTGSALSGKPRNLSVTYSQAYIDEETQEMASANMIHVFTEANEYKGFRTEDMAEIFDRTNLLFDNMGSDEMPYGMIRTTMYIYYLSSNGLRAVSPGDMGLNSGKFGFATGVGGSTFIQYAGDLSTGLAYWNETDHHIDIVTGFGSMVIPVVYDMPVGVDESKLECISCGLNFIGYDKTVWFLSQDNVSGKRYLYLMEGVGQEGVSEVRELDANLHIAQSDVIAGNALSATVIYCVHDNKLYAYDWKSNTEFDVALPGIASGEKLTYLSNQYLNIGEWGDQSSNFDNLIVGTQIDDTYKLYFYDNLVGGVPAEKSSREITGTGVVRKVRFASSIPMTMTELMTTMGAPIIPSFD